MTEHKTKAHDEQAEGSGESQGDDVKRPDRSEESKTVTIQATSNINVAGQSLAAFGEPVTVEWSAEVADIINGGFAEVVTDEEAAGHTPGKRAKKG